MPMLSGKTAVVTGASRGIGRACAMRLAELGANVVVNFLNSRDAATDVVRAAVGKGVQCVAIRADVSRQEDSHALIEATVKRFGGLDIVVSNAAAGGFRGVADLSPANFEAAVRTNAAPVAWLAQAAATHLAKNPPAAPGDHPAARGRLGKMIAISSHGSIRAVSHYAAIGASKAALESLVRHLALEYGPLGINFNCVMPGIVATEAIATMPQVESIIHAAAQRMLVGGRSLTPEDVAGTVAFLAGPDSDLIQGQTIVIDGGITIRV